ncbi:unnamed protein product [Paramecium sonneborni]|uniref:Uncharacterized protein n=1 Tax=Paramecium sonneborni TaxID=65129 RepID=A0A8S1RMC9_9CILI|nr:unnamed protein product [Paramecium sonneborni]CAD8127966.1 unnamed protein product [Paramecium sonneborni]
MSDLCQNCKHRSLKQKMTGKKFSMHILNQIQQLRSPRNIETPFINIIDYLQKIHRKKDDDQEQEQESEKQQQYSHIPTHISKQKTDNQVEEATTTTSRQIQFPVSLCISRGASANKIKSSAFYKMRQMSLGSRDKKKRRNIEIGPMFNQVSKYVHPMRPQTVRSFNSKIDDVFKSTQTTSRQELIRQTKSEINLRLPVSNKLSEVQSLMRKE